MLDQPELENELEADDISSNVAEASTQLHVKCCSYSFTILRFPLHLQKCVAFGQNRV